MPKWQSWGPCLVVVGWVWAVPSEAVKETAAVDAVTVYHDSGGIHPQCTQGPSDYIHNCVRPADLPMYMQSATPTVTTDGSTTCSSLGYTFVMHSPIFPMTDLYWRNGVDGYEAWATQFKQTHPLGAAIVNQSRASVPACATVADPHQAKGGGVGMVAALLSVGTIAPNETVALYDAAEYNLECAQGVAAYMLNCALLSDAYFYFRAKQPTVVVGGCTDVNPRNEMAIKSDPVFHPMSVYFPGGAKAFFKNQTGFLLSHRALTADLERLMKHNPACAANFAQE